MTRLDYERFSIEQHEAELDRIINPDERAAYYQAFINPQAIVLGTAENRLLLPYLRERAFTNLPALDWPTAKYPSGGGGAPYNGGSEAMLKSVARFLSVQWRVEIDHKDLYGSAGVLTALETIALALFEPGDELLIPAPFYHGFPWPFCQKTVRMKLVPFEIDGGVNLTAANVKAALERNPKAKLLVLTNPGNPLGVNYPKALLEEIYSLFLADGNRHIISDEIYAGAQVGDGNAFVSALALDAYRKFGDRIHVTWGLSKDFGLAGFRAGFLISKAERLVQALTGRQCGPVPSWYASQAWFSPFVSLQPYVLQKLFLDERGNPDPRLAHQAMTVFRGLLKQQYALAAGLLDAGGISYFQQNQGALFFWIDLTKFLRFFEDTPIDPPPLCRWLYVHDSPREQRLLKYIEEAGVLLIRGQACFNTAPGFFRLCYSAVTAEDLTSGIRKMIAALQRLGS